MAKFIVFGNQKGGIGKTTLTVLVANGLSQPPFNKKVLLIDNDNQKSAIRLREYDEKNYEKNQPPYLIRAMSYKQIVASISDIDEMYDYVFIDTPGKLDANLPPEAQQVTKILLLTDYLFMPFKAGALNLDATTDYVKVLLQAQRHRNFTKRPLIIFGVVNFYKERSRINRELKDELVYLTKNVGLSFMETPLKQYISYEYLNTYESMYNPKSNDLADKNFFIFLNEFFKKINNND
jgi:chromosome partitioning protein